MISNNRSRFMMKKNLQRILKFFRVSFEKFKNPKKKHKRNLFFPQSQKDL